MVNVPPQFYEVYNIVAGVFSIDPTWLVYPNIITIFIIPLILNVIAMYFILERLVKVFPGTGVNYVIGGIIGFMMLPYNEVMMWITPAIIALFGPENKIVKLAVAATLYIFINLILPYLLNLTLIGF